MSLPPSNGKTVLITGINGYIASVLGLDFLSRGYNLRGTTRAKASAAALLSDAYAAYTSRVEVIEVPDMKAHGAFDEAVKGIPEVLFGWQTLTHGESRDFCHSSYSSTNGFKSPELGRMGVAGNRKLYGDAEIRVYTCWPSTRIRRISILDCSIH